MTAKTSSTPPRGGVDLNPGAKGQKPTSWRRLRTRATQVLTPLWWGVSAVALSALGLALLTHWVELAVIGLVLGVLALLSPLSALGLGKHNINLYVQNERVVVGDNAYGELQATNAGTRRTRKAVMELPVGKSTADVLVPSLRAGQMISQPLAIPTARRGLVPIGPVRSVNGDGLGLVRRGRRWSIRVRWLWKVKPLVSLRILRELRSGICLAQMCLFILCVSMCPAMIGAIFTGSLRLTPAS